MAILHTVYDNASGKPVYEGFGSDPRENETGFGVVHTAVPALEEGPGLPVCGIEQVWVMAGRRVLREGFALSRLSLAGLTATLGEGHFFGEVHAQAAEEDSYTFDTPGSDTAVALDVALDARGKVQLQPYQWDPEAQPPQTKGDLPQGWTLVEGDVLRGVLPAGAASLAELREEE